MRPSVVVVLAVLLDQNLRFNQVGERLPLEQLIPKASDERLRIGILPGGSRLDVQSLHLRERQPLLERSGYEFGAILSEQMNTGAPRCSNRRSRVPITYLAVMDHSTSIAKHS